VLVPASENPNGLNFVEGSFTFVLAAGLLVNELGFANEEITFTVNFIDSIPE
jgi:hypothetical protein